MSTQNIMYSEYWYLFCYWFWYLFCNWFCNLLPVWVLAMLLVFQFVCGICLWFWLCNLVMQACIKRWKCSLILNKQVHRLYYNIHFLARSLFTIFPANFVGFMTGERWTIMVLVFCLWPLIVATNKFKYWVFKKSNVYYWDSPLSIFCVAVCY